MADFVMPSLGADMEAGTLAAWKKQPGDRVTKGEIIAEVETDKAAIEVEVFTTGVIERLLVQPGEKVPVGTVLAIIREEEPAGSVRPEPQGEGAGEADDRALRIRQAIAAAMARSKREIPHYYLSTTIELGRLMAWLVQENRTRGLGAAAPGSLVRQSRGARPARGARAEWLRAR